MIRFAIQFLVSSLVMLGSLPHAYGAGQNEWVKADGSLMMALRSNANHFWNWAKLNSSHYFLPAVLQTTGVVAGDAHHENFSYAFARDGRRLYVMNDLDDAGVAPLILDLVKFAGVCLSAVESKASLGVADLFDSYVNGLNGLSDSLPTPDWLMKDAEITVDQLQSDYLGKIKKATKDGQFEPEAGLTRADYLTPAQKKVFENLEAQVFIPSLPVGYTEQDIKDRAVFAKGGGGSQGVTRYLYYLSKSKSDRQILEFKPVPLPAVSNYHSSQLNGLDRIEAAVKIYWSPDGLPSPFAIVGTGQNAFWERPRYPSYVKFDAKMFSKHPIKFAELSRFIAGKIGGWHKAQLNSTQYVDYLQEHREELIARIEASVQDYLQVARTAQNKN